MEKITEKQTEVETALSELSGCPMAQLDPRVLEVYRGVREVSPELPLPHPRSAQELLRCLYQSLEDF